MTDRSKIICIFDVDGTLTKPRQVIDKEMLTFLTEEVKPKCTIGLVGGSDYDKICEQMGGVKGLEVFDYVFSENGLVARKNMEVIGCQSILKYLGEEKLQSLINFCLLYMSKLHLPAKRGTFIEFRTGLINVCPVGRSCTQKEREEFAQFDAENNVRIQFVNELKKAFPENDLTYSIGGQISIDIFPNGWDKTYCLKYLEEISTIHFFGDKTEQGGNDYEIYCDKRVNGNSVSGPEHTKQLLVELFKRE